MKKCNKCGVDKPLDQFNKSGNSNDGHRSECRQCQSEYNAKFRKTHYDCYIKPYQTAWVERNKDRRAAHCAKYQKTNKAVVNTNTARRRAARILRTPAWADQTAIKAYFDVCSFFNEINGYVKYHVDHVIPLAGKKVCGLHVHQNLRVILASENYLKNNKFEI